MPKNEFIVKTNNPQFFGLLLFCFLGGMLVFIDGSKPSCYTALPLLPLSFGLTALVFSDVFHHAKRNLAVLILFFLYFTRNVLLPIFISLGRYRSPLFISSDDNLVVSILLMCYEVIAVFGALYLMRDKYMSQVADGHALLQRKERRWGAVEYVSFFLVFFLLFVVFEVPEVLLKFSSIFLSGSLTMSNLDLEGYIPRELRKRALFTIFDVLFSVLRIMIPALVMRWMAERIKKKRIAVLFSILLIFLQLLFITSQTMFTLIVIGVLSLLLMKLYPLYRKQLLCFLVIGLLACLCVIIAAKSSGSGNSDFLLNASLFLQSYFPGVANVAGIFEIKDINKVQTFLFDLYTVVPFRNSLFGLKGETSLSLFRTANSGAGQVIPCFGQAYIYFGPFAVFIPIFLANIALKYESKRNSEVNAIEYTVYSFIVVYSAATPVLYYLPLFGQVYTTIILPLLFLSYLSKTGNDRRNQLSFR